MATYFVDDSKTGEENFTALMKSIYPGYDLSVDEFLAAFDVHFLKNDGSVPENDIRLDTFLYREEGKGSYYRNIKIVGRPYMGYTGERIITISGIIDPIEDLITEVFNESEEKKDIFFGTIQFPLKDFVIAKGISHAELLREPERLMNNDTNIRKWSIGWVMKKLGLPTMRHTLIQSYYGSYYYSNKFTFKDKEYPILRMKLNLYNSYFSANENRIGKALYNKRYLIDRLFYHAKSLEKVQQREFFVLLKGELE